MRDRRENVKRSRMPAPGGIPTTPMRSSLRKPYIFSLSKICDDAIDRLAKTYECSRSAAVERMFTMDYPDLFKRFELRQSFATVVIETRVDPSWVRLAYDHYTQGYETASLSDSQLLDKKINAELAELQAKLEVQSSKIESNERIEISKLETKKELADRRAKLEADRAENQARIEQLKSLSAPVPSVARMGR